MNEAIFSTPIYRTLATKIDTLAINNEISSKCKDIQYSKRPDWVSSNHSLSDVSFTDNLIDQYDLQLLKKFIKKHTNAYINSMNGTPLKFEIQQSWMTYTKKGEHTVMHNHAKNDIAGVYYYKTNGKDGSIQFLNPNPAYDATIFFTEHLAVYPPQEGALILFPGWLHHQVTENTTDNVRMSLSFNINLKRLWNGE